MDCYLFEDREVDFDVNIAISVCRQAGYCRHALALAEKHHKHDLYLQIQIDNEHDFDKALEYIRCDFMIFPVKL
jgi:hypothetical protein